MSEAREDTRSLTAVTLHTLILVFTTLLSLSGNCLVCLTFYRNRRLRTITNFYVLSLAVADIFFSTFGYPFGAIASGLRKWPFGYKFCQFEGFLSYLWVLVSINILALTAINRYFCVVKPHIYPTLFTRRNTVSSIIFVELFIFGFYLVVTLVTATSYQWHPYYLFCQMVGVNNSVHTADHALAFTFLTVFVGLPMCIMLFCYGSVYCTIRRHNSAVIPSLQEANSQGSVRAQEIQASRVLLAAVVAFCLCWISATLVIILENIVHLTIPPFWQSFHTLTAACSSWINPIIYGVMNRAMRIEFLKLLHYRN